MHLLLDGFQGNKASLSSQALVERLLNDLPQQAGMRIIGGPYVLDHFDPEHPADAGVTGAVIIAESHMAIHTFPERAIVWVDLFSCKDFWAEPIVQAISEAFSLGFVDFRLEPRGLDQPMRRGDFGWSSRVPRLIPSAAPA